MATLPLDGSGTQLEIGEGLTLSAPAVRGTVTTIPVPPGARPRAFGEESFDAQLESAGLRRTHIVELDGTTPAEPGARALGGAAGELRVELGPGEGAVVLVEDETGALFWLTGAWTREIDVAPERALTFTIPLAPAPTGARGIGGVLKKVLKVFRFPVEKVEDGIGDIVSGFIQAWERKHRPYLVCAYGPDEYRAAKHDAFAVGPGEWPRLGAGRALLFVHGTFSSCDAFSAITPEVMAELGRRYEGRLFAFDHPTLADDPTQNAQHLLAAIPPELAMTLDVVCHSRGGLVAREIARLGRERKIDVGRIVMVGVPNGGTALANERAVLGLVNRLTTLAKLFPNRAVAVTVDALVATVKVLARGLLEDMPGLRAMNADADYLQGLNRGAAASELFAIASNFEPKPGTPLFSVSRAEDAAADALFHQENDLVVPTIGGYAVAAAGFPVPAERRHLFAPEAGVVHTHYFEQPATLQRLTEWLGAAEMRSLAEVRARGLSAGNVESLRAHVVNLSDGGFSRRGGFRTTAQDVDAIFDAHLAKWIADRPGQRARVVVWAHGGLINEKDGLEIAFKHVEWWKRNEVFPIYFVWETGLFDALGSLLASAGRTSRAVGARDFTDFGDHLVEGVCRRLRGDLIWGAMKTNAERSSARNGGAAYVAERLTRFCAAHPEVELHAVGHSAGSIFHSHFLPTLARGGAPRIASLQLLAPAIRVDAFKQRLAPMIGKQVQTLRMFSMTDETERRDDCMGVYRKSLLYLIHHALEPEERVPILGLEVSALHDPEIRALFEGEAAAAIWSVTQEATGDGASRSTSHGGFDDDPATMTSVVRHVLGADRERAKPYLGDARRGREWPVTEGLRVAIAPAAAAPAAPLPPAAAEPARGPRVETAAGRRLALCIGIDKYAGDDRLYGCVEDARAWKRLLEETLHFDRVGTLTDYEATRERIGQAVRQLLEDARPGDTVVLQYSGHGTSLPDDDEDDEADGTDEAIVPIDYRDANFITDDDIRGFFTDHLKDGVRLTVFMDCCHSGTITRVLGRTAKEPVPGMRARYLRVAPEIVQEYRVKRAVERDQGVVRKFQDRSTLAWVNFSACDATERAFEQNGNGDFTRHALALLAGGVGVTNAEFQQRLVREFGEQRRQTPQLDCPLDAEEVELFGYAPGAVDHAAPAEERRGEDRRRAEASAPGGYDRRSGLDRRQAYRAAQLREIAEDVESWRHAERSAP